MSRALITLALGLVAAAFWLPFVLLLPSPWLEVASCWLAAAVVITPAVVGELARIGQEADEA